MKTRDTKLIKNWIKALRSGEYKQDTCQLKTSNGYCCLGVLVEIHLEWNISEVSGYCIDSLNKTVSGEKEFPPLEILHDCGMSVDDARKLIHMNDVKLLSFKQIADYIETEMLSDE